MLLAVLVDVVVMSGWGLPCFAAAWFSSGRVAVSGHSGCSWCGTAAVGSWLRPPAAGDGELRFGPRRWSPLVARGGAAWGGAGSRVTAAGRLWSSGCFMVGLPAGRLSTWRTREDNEVPLGPSNLADVWL